MGLMTLSEGAPWRSPSLLRFLYISSIVAAVLLSLAATFLASKTWYLNQHGILATGTILEPERNGQGWRVTYQSEAAQEVEAHVDWVPEGTQRGDRVKVAHASSPLVTPQLVGTPMADALPLLGFAVVPAVASLYYRRLYRRVAPPTLDQSQR